jgi:hypothetical protein
MDERKEAQEINTSISLDDLIEAFRDIGEVLGIKDVDDDNGLPIFYTLDYGDADTVAKMMSDIVNEFSSIGDKS